MSANRNLPPSALAHRWNSTPSSSSFPPVRPDNPSDFYADRFNNKRKRPRHLEYEHLNHSEHKPPGSFADNYGSAVSYRPPAWDSRSDCRSTQQFRSETQWNSSSATSQQHDGLNRSPYPWNSDGRYDHRQTSHSKPPNYQTNSLNRAGYPPSDFPTRPCWSSTPTVGASPSPPRRVSSRTSFSKKRRMVPLPEYLESAKSEPVRLDVPSMERKLVLLDLNGTLVFRPKASAERTFRRRPFVGAFLDYLRARWEIGVWSSAQPHSVTKMIEFLRLQGGKDPHQLKLIWARDTFGLTPVEFNQKTETVKDLDMVYRHLEQEACVDGSSVRYSNESTLLIDDSYTKTGCQPFNHIPVPDYDGRLSTQSARAFKHASDAAPSKKKKKKKIGVGASTGSGEEERQDEGMDVDRTLLAVVGILERARGEESIVAWLKTGGLVPDLKDPDGWWVINRSLKNKKGDDDAEVDDEVVLEEGNRDYLNLVYPVRRSGPVTTIPRSELLPSESSPTPSVPWFESPEHLDFWIHRGIETLRSMKIDMVHGMDLSFIPRTDEEVAAAKIKKLAKAERQAECSTRTGTKMEEV